MLLENDLYPQDVRVRDEAVSLTQAGYEVSVIAPRGRGQARRESIQGVSVHRYWLPMDHRGRVAQMVGEYLVAHVQLYLRGMSAVCRSADVIHLHNPPDTLLGPSLLARILGRQVVFDQHDLFCELFLAKYGRSALFHLFRWSHAATIRLANLVIATNESHRDHVVATGAIPAASVRIVRNGPPTSALTQATGLRRGALWDPHIVYLGALEAQDGVDALPKLVSLLVERHELVALRLTVIGWGSQQDALCKALSELGLADRARVTGRVSHATVLSLLAGADICVDTAPCNAFNDRTTMVKIAEYMALGRPTVAYPLKETRRTAQDAISYARCGDLDHFAELVSRLAKDFDLRRALGARARKRAETLVWEHQAKELLACYRDLAERRLDRWSGAAMPASASHRARD